MNRSVMRILTNAIIVVLLFFSVFTRCMLNNIKDTDTILHDDYQYLSLVHGAIAWETGVIRRLYDFGQIFPKYKEDKQGRKLIESYEHPDQASKLVRLIHVLFYRIPGSTGSTDFGVTTQLALEDPAIVVALVAELLVQCGQLEQQREQFKQAIAYAQEVVLKLTQEQVSTLGKNVTQTSLDQIIKDAQEKPWDRNVGERFVSTCKSIVKNLPEISQEFEMHRQAAQKFFDLLIASTQNLKKLVKPVVFKSKESIDSFIFEALNESDPNNSESLYPAHTVEMMLLAFIYKKYSADRNMLKMFYNLLNTKLSKKLLYEELTETWVTNNFNSVTQVEAIGTIEHILKAQNIKQSINQHFAKFVYNVLQARSFPMPTGFALITYEYAQGKKTPQFSDCVCNDIRNFINLYAYDFKQNKFTLSTLEKTMNIKVVLPALAGFLQIFGSVNKTSSLEAHSAWVYLVANIPYAAYRKMVSATTGIVMQDNIGKGYITIPQDEQSDALVNWLTLNKYKVLTSNQYNYELRASVKNIIIVLNHLLQLNIFIEAGGLAKEFMRSDFIKEYFPKLCTALNAHGFLSTKINATEWERNIDFDSLDYTETKIYTTITLAGITCQFETNSKHGEISSVEVQGEEQLIIPLLEKIINFAHQPSLSLLVTSLLCSRNKIVFDHLKNNPEYVYLNLFAIPLENTGLLESIIDKSMSVKVNIKTKINIKDLLLRLAEKQPNTVIKQNMKWRILILFVQSLSFNDITANNIDIKEVVQMAEKGFMNHDIDVKISALSLFEALFEKNQGFKQAASVAEKEIVDNNYLVRDLALDLFTILFVKGQGFKEAIQAAEKGFVDVNSGVRDSAVKLFKGLFARDQGFKEAIQIAEKGFVDVNSNVRDSVLDLFKLLFTRDQGFKEAAQVAEKGLTDSNSDVRNSALGLFKILFTKKQGFQEAIQAAEKGIVVRDIEVVLSALSLFNQLIIKVPDKTKKSIQQLLDNPNITINSYVKQELSMLLKK